MEFLRKIDHSPSHCQRIVPKYCVWLSITPLKNTIQCMICICELLVSLRTLWLYTHLKHILIYCILHYCYITTFIMMYVHIMYLWIVGLITYFITVHSSKTYSYILHISLLLHYYIYNAVRNRTTHFWCILSFIMDFFMKYFCKHDKWKLVFKTLI